MLDFTLDLCFCFAFFKEPGWSCPSPTFGYRAGVLYFGKLLILQMLSKLKKPMSGLQSIWAKGQIVKDAFLQVGPVDISATLSLIANIFQSLFLITAGLFQTPRHRGGGGLHITIKIIFGVS